jgi:Family of unknown function (DUF5302)
MVRPPREDNCSNHRPGCATLDAERPEPQEVRMAVEQSGSEASPTPGKPAAAASQPDAAPSQAASADAASQPDPAGAGQPDGAKSDLDEVKRKFREALDRKRSAHASANAEGAHDTGKVHGAHGPAASRRSFRRKSGSS